MQGVKEVDVGTLADVEVMVGGATLAGAEEGAETLVEGAEAVGVGVVRGNCNASAFAFTLAYLNL